MGARQQLLLPLHDFLVLLTDWQGDRTANKHAELEASFARIVEAHGVSGARLAIEAAPLSGLTLASGTLTNQPDEDPPATSEHQLEAAVGSARHATLTIAPNQGDSDAALQLVDAVELCVAAVVAREQAVTQHRQLEALDVAVRGIATLTSVEGILQLIVDRVRELAGARYAALGIVGSYGRIDQFIVSGITPEQRALLGAPPQGHGLLGLIIREDRSLLIDDIATDPRRYGFPEHHPEMHSLLGVPVRSRGRTIGNLYLTNKTTAPTFDAADLELVERFALHAAIAIENARLHEEIGRLAIVEERQRISQDLHDSIIQSLYAISLSLEDLPDVIAEDPAEGAARSDRAIDGIHATIRDIRNFIMGLQPELLAEADLVTGIRTLGAEFEANTLIDLELELDPNVVEPPHDVAAHVLAVTREALSNVYRHSGATRATLSLSANDGNLILVVSDNGRGFNVDQTRSSRQRGLTNLRARAEATGGTIELMSAASEGTRLELTIPTNEREQ